MGAWGDRWGTTHRVPSAPRRSTSELTHLGATPKFRLDKYFYVPLTDVYVSVESTCLRACCTCGSATPACLLYLRVCYTYVPAASVCLLSRCLLSLRACGSAAPACLLRLRVYCTCVSTAPACLLHLRTCCTCVSTGPACLLHLRAY